MTSNQFKPNLEDDDDDSYDETPSAFSRIIAILTCRGKSHADTFSGAEDSIRVGLKKGISKAGVKKARTGSMYVPRATMPILDIEDPDEADDAGNTTDTGLSGASGAN